MSRYIRNSALLARTETTYGTEAIPTGADHAMLISDVSVNPLNAQNVNRDLIRPYFGGSEQLVGVAFVELSFTVELAGSGTAATPPAWGTLLLGCGFAEAATTFVAYTPASPADQDSLTMYYHDDGVLHKLLGARGTFQVGLTVGERPTLRFTFQGLYGGVSAVSNPTTTLTAWRTPLVVTDTNTLDLTLGGTYASGAVTGGTSYTSRGLSIDVGNAVNFTPMLGGEFVEITQREVTATTQLSLSAAQEVSLMTAVRANTVQAMSLQHGTVAGAIVGVHMAGAQLINPRKEDLNGRRLIGFDVRAVPVAGNDDILIWSR